MKDMQVRYEIPLVDDTLGAKYTNRALCIISEPDAIEFEEDDGKFPRCAYIYVGGKTFRTRAEDVTQRIGISMPIYNLRS